MNVSNLMDDKWKPQRSKPLTFGFYKALILVAILKNMATVWLKSQNNHDKGILLLSHLISLCVVKLEIRSLA